MLVTRKSQLFQLEYLKKYKKHFPLFIASLYCRLTTKGFRKTVSNTEIHQQARQEEIGGTIRVEGFSGMLDFFFVK